VALNRKQIKYNINCNYTWNRKKINNFYNVYYYISGRNIYFVISISTKLQRVYTYIYSYILYIIICNIDALFVRNMCGGQVKYAVGEKIIETPRVYQTRIRGMNVSRLNKNYKRNVIVISVIKYIWFVTTLSKRDYSKSFKRMPTYIYVYIYVCIILNERLQFKLFTR